VYRVDQSKQAHKDEETARRNGQSVKFVEIMTVLRENPFEPTPGHYFEKLTGNLKGYYSRRINYHNRFTYTVHPNDEGAMDDKGNLYEGIVRVHESWGHKYSTPGK